jgi:NADPH-dependent glutamate synthase beta subunit-like oxidoreductase
MRFIEFFQHFLRQAGHDVTVLDQMPEAGAC